jgi:hypothetical protein
MTQWLRGGNLFQKVALALMFLALGAVILSALLGGSSPLGFLLLAFIIGYIAFRKELLWPVRNRLLVTYILFGVVSIFLIALGLTLAAELLLGQIATQRVSQDLEARIESVRSAAQTLALTACPCRKCYPGRMPWKSTTFKKTKPKRSEQSDRNVTLLHCADRRMEFLVCTGSVMRRGGIRLERGGGAERRETAALPSHPATETAGGIVC